MKGAEAAGGSAGHAKVTPAEAGGTQIKSEQKMELVLPVSASLLGTALAPEDSGRADRGGVG